MKPAKGKKVKLSAILESGGKKVEGEAAFAIIWKEDLSDKLKAADQAAELDDRMYTIRECSEWNDLKTKISNNKAMVEVESTVPHDAWGSNRKALEIYACIRAEYKYIDAEGYKKVSSRTGDHGIDHIFIKGDDYVIVESKTISDLSKVARLTTLREPDSIISVLGKGRKSGVSDDGVLYATQMSIDWLQSCLDDLAAKKNTTARKVRSEWRNGNPPKRVLNIYGGIDWNAKGAYDELEAEAKRQYDEAVAEYDGAKANLEKADLQVKQAKTPDQKIKAIQKKENAKLKFNKAEKEYSILPKLKKTSVDGKTYVGSKTKKGGAPTGQRDFLFIHKEWETSNPNKGLYYLLPGKYELGKNSRAAWLIAPESIEGTPEVDFADEKFRDEEFFELDTLPESTLAKLDELKKEETKENDSIADDSEDF